MKNEKLRQLAHLVAGLIVAVHGFDAFETSNYNSAAVYLSISVFFIVVAGLHKKFIRQFVGGDVAFFLLEAFVILYSGWHYNTKGHWYLYIAMCITAIAYLIFAVSSINVSGDNPKRRRSRNHRRRRQSSSYASYSTLPSNASGGSERG